MFIFFVFFSFSWSSLEGARDPLNDCQPLSCWSSGDHLCWGHWLECVCWDYIFSVAMPTNQLIFGCYGNKMSELSVRQHEFSTTQNVFLIGDPFDFWIFFSEHQGDFILKSLLIVDPVNKKCPLVDRMSRSAGRLLCSPGPDSGFAFYFSIPLSDFMFPFISIFLCIKSQPPEGPHWCSYTGDVFA